MGYQIFSNSVSPICQRLRIDKLSGLLGLLAAAWVASSCATSKQDTRGGMNLYSWRLRNAQYAFAFVPKRENDDFLRTFKRQRSRIVGIAELDIELAKFPRGSSITWRD
jgi:hypothetical protein